MSLTPVPAKPLRLLVTGEGPASIEALLQRLAAAGYAPTAQWVSGAAQIQAALADGSWDLVIGSHALPCLAALGGLAQATPQASEARLGAIAANTPGVIFRLRQGPDGGLDFLYAGGATQLLLGLSPADLTADGQRYTAMILAEDRPGFDAALAASRESGKLNWEGRIRSPEGDLKWVNLRGSVHPGSHGEPIWEGVMWNITQSKQTEADLRESQSQLAALSRHLQNAKEEERERIARDVHDVLGGNLVALKIELSLLTHRLASDPADARGRVAAIAGLLDEAIATVSRVTRELRPGILKDFGLAAAVECQAEDFFHRTGLPVHILAADHDIDLPEEAGIALFRIFQEALTNVCKHANATQVTVRLMQEGDEIRLEIQDDGRGIRHEDLRRPRSFGLRGIQERLASLGGQFVITATPPAGTRLTATLPATLESPDHQP